MSWIEMLYRTYENSQNEVGRFFPAKLDHNGKHMRPPRPLLPVYHTLQNSNIEIVLDIEGNYIKNATTVIPKIEAMTIIPCTEESANRTGQIAPHPLFDTLQYLAGDYKKYGGDKASGYEKYCEQLQDWCCSPYSHPSVKAVYTYILKGCLIEDLVSDGILHCGDEGKLLRSWNGDKEDTPPIFKTLNDPLTSFIRIRVRNPSSMEDALYLDQSVRNSYIEYVTSKDRALDLCYVQGKRIQRSEYSSKYIRRPGDGAKLISSNDKSGFTFRGRFDKSIEAFSVGVETTDKAHSALKWLIDRQGWHNGEQVILCWGTRGEDVPALHKDGWDFFGGDVLEQVDTESAYAEKLNIAISGYGSKGLDEKANVVVMVLDSAVPGRLSIPYYRELNGSEFLERIKHWYRTCVWTLSKTLFETEQNKKGGFKSRRTRYMGSPAPVDIVYAAYGRGVSDSLKKATIERLMPCIMDKSPVPPDLVRSVARRASNPQGMEEDWEYEQTIDIACALIRKSLNDRYNKQYRSNEYQEVWKLALDEENRDRSYLFGRILAYYDNLETWANSLAGESRMTNAKRLMIRYRQAPAKTAEILDRQIQPYIRRLGDRATYRLHKLNELYDLLNGKDENGNKKFNNTPLNESYLLGYRSQLNDFYFKSQEAKN